MTLSIRTIVRSLSVLALTAAFLPGCDSAEYEALGLSSEEIDAMSEEELDELAALEDDDDGLGHSVNLKHITNPVHPGDPPKSPTDLSVLPTHAEGDAPQLFANPVRPTHGDIELFANPVRPTHGDIELFANPVRPTHTAPMSTTDLGVEGPGGCDPHPANTTQLTNS